MAEFVASPIVDPSVDPMLATNVQRNSLAALSQQQDLTDRATFRQNAPGLLARDPTATASAMGANPTASQAFLSSIPNMDANTREQASSDIAASGSLAGAVLSQPADQRQAAWDAGRQTLIASGHKMVPPETYPGDGALQTMRGLASTAQQQFDMTPQIPTVNPTPYLASTPGGGYVGPGGVQGQAGGDVTATPLPAPGQPGQVGGPSSSYASNMMGVESGNNATAQNPNSSATGAGQFIDSTWLNLLPQVRPDLAQGRTPQQQLALRTDPAVSAQMVNGYAQQNAPKLAAAGVPVNDTTLALAHRFGPDVAAQVANAPPGTPIANIVGPGVMAVNQDLQGQTAGSITGFYAQRVGGGAPARVQMASAANSAGMPQTATDAAPSGVSGSAVGARIQQQRQQGFTIPPSAASNSSQPGAVVPPAGPVSAAPGSYDPNNVTNVDSPAQAQGMPGDAPWRLPDGTVHMNARQAEPILVPPVGGSGRSNALLLPPQPQAAPAQPSTAAGPGGNQNALSGLGAIAPTAPNQLTGLGITGNARVPNALLPVSQPSGTQASPPSAQPQPIAGAQPSATPQTAPLPWLHNPRTGAMVPVAGQSGYFLAQGPGGSMVAQRMPGAPGAGVDTIVTPSGSLISSDKQSGALVQNIPGIAPNSGRLTAVDDGRGGKIMVDPQGRVQYESPSNTSQTLQMQDYTRDQGVAQSAAEELNQAKQTDFAIREQRGITSGLAQTGAFGERKAALSNYLESTFSPDTASAFEKAAGLDSGSMDQLFAKTAIQASGQQENANVGARGGFGLTNLYLKANPGLQTLPTAVRDVQNLQAVSNLSQQDYLQGLLGYINQNSTAFHQPGGKYSPSTNFSQQWNSGNNPQVYVAAAEALNQQPYSKWSAGLSGPDQQRALSIAARADNTASYIGPNGPAALTPFGAPQQSGSAAPNGSAPSAAASSGPPPPAVGSISRGFRFNGGDPSSPNSWSRAQ